jgi:hypothetical protein
MIALINAARMQNWNTRDSIVEGRIFTRMGLAEEGHTMETLLQDIRASMQSLFCQVD